MHYMDFIFEAMQLMENKETKRALKLINDQLPNANDEQKYAIVEFYLQWGFFEEAKELLHVLIRQYPDESELKVLLANIYIDLENDQEAIQLLNEVREGDPSYEQALLQLADLYQSQGLFEVAEQKLLQAKQINPDEIIIDLALGEFYFSIAEYPKAVLYYERIIEQTKEVANISITARLAEALASSGQYEQALHYYEQLDSDDPDLLFKFGLTAYHTDRKDLAIQVWNQVLEIDEYYHTVYYELANTYHEEGMLPEAYRISQQGIQKDNFNKELFYLAGVIAYELEKYDESEKHLSNAVALDPDYLDAGLFLIKMYKEEDDYDKIVDFISDLQAQGTTDPMYQWELASAYSELDDYDLAAEHYEEAYSYLNHNSDFLKEYGYFLVEYGQVQQAIPILKAYLNYEPTDLDMQDYLERLEDIYEE